MLINRGKSPGYRNTYSKMFHLHGTGIGTLELKRKKKEKKIYYKSSSSEEKEKSKHILGPTVFLHKTMKKYLTRTLYCKIVF